MYNLFSKYLNIRMSQGIKLSLSPKKSISPNKANSRSPVKMGTFPTTPRGISKQKTILLN